MTINLHLPGKADVLRPSITVVGVGGAGGNAVNNMINSNLEGVNFVVANTDAQALENAMTERRIQLGTTITRGLGAGASPEVGRAAAEEAMDEISSYIEGSNMVFITAGMGGGTGTGAAPVVARLAKERGILTVGVVTKPFQFEGAHRMRLAEKGLEDLQEYVDTLIVIPNQNLFRIANEKTTFADAFRMADEVLHSGVRGVTDLMIMPGLINLDFADIRTVMREMGKAMMGTGEAEGAKRAVEAAEAAISNPLLDDVSMKGARGVLINITGGYDMTLYEADEAATRIREEVDPDANIIFGATFNASLEGKIRVSVVATGIDAIQASENKPQSTIDTSRFYGGKMGFGARPAESTVSVRPVNLPPARPPVTEPVAKREPVAEMKPMATPVSGLRSGFLRSHPAAQAAAVAQPLMQPVMSPQPVVEKPAPAPVSVKVEETQLVFAAKIRTSVGAAAQTQGESGAFPAFPSKREPSFVTPPVAQPAQRSFFPTSAAPEVKEAPAGGRSGKISPREQGTHASSERDASSGSMSFFQRMAGVGRVLTSKPEQTERNLVVNKPKAEVTERAPAKSAEDDYLEIPAFLRRQAN